MSHMTRGSEDAAAEMAAECLAMRSRLIGRTITGIYDSALRPAGVTAGQLSILAALVRHGPISPGEVARRLNIEKSTMSRNVRRMERNGWLAIRPGESGPSQELRITNSGRRILEEARPLWHEAQRRAREVLGAGGTQAIHQLADAVSKASGG